MMRQVFLDTETTGRKPPEHRVIEIGCVEVIDRKLTGNHFHTYINPKRDIDPGAFAVHGLDYNQLKDKPLFEDIVEELILFIKDAEILMHNAPFDVGFINSEFVHIKYNTTMEEIGNITDTLKVARKMRPRQRNSLDALCQAYDVDLSKRSLHGALLDAELLAQMYLKLTAGQHNLDINSGSKSVLMSVDETPKKTIDLRTRKIVIEPTKEELEADQAAKDLWHL